MAGDGTHESIQDLVEELQVEEPEIETSEPDKEEPGEEEEPKEDKEDKEPKEDKEDKEDKEEVKSTFTGQITKKYPNLFKDFPNLRHIIFHEREYRELFPTVEEAREAGEDLDGLKELENALVSGDEGDIAGVIDSMNALGDEVVSNFATGFLPSIKKLNQDLYYQVMTPELVNVTRSMFDAGLRNENENLKNAALVLAQHLFGDPRVASGEKEIKLPERKQRSREDNELENERKQFRQERYTTFYNDVVGSADRQLSTIIEDGLDPKNSMTKGVKELAVDKILKEITKTLSNDNVHTSKMNSIWRKAGSDNFSNSWKSKIISAYLEAAEEILPRIRSKIRNEVLGIRERHSGNDVGSKSGENRREPRSTTGGGTQSRGSNNNQLDPKKIDWRKTSDLDMIKGNITYKKEK